MILNTEFGLFGQLLDPMKKIFFKFSKIRNSRNSQNSVWKPNFVLRTLYQSFLLYTPITLVILHTPIGLIWTTPQPDEKNLFSKIPFSRNSQKFRTKTQFFSEASSNNFFLLYTLITLLILNTEFGLIWTTPWPAEKKLNFSKIRNSRKSQNSVWKPNFFLGALYQYFFFALHSH